MPMTKRQLQQVHDDYAHYLPVGGKVVACELATPGDKSTCDICGEPLTSEYHWKDIDGDPQISYYRRSAKQIVVEVEGRWIRHYRLLVCRQGVTCRKVRKSQIREVRPNVAA